MLACSVYITSVNTSSVDAHFADVISKEHISVLRYSNDRLLCQILMNGDIMLLVSAKSETVVAVRALCLMTE